MRLITRTTLIVLMFIMLGSVGGKAQESTVKTPAKFSDRLFWGGSLGLTIGDITQVDVIPVGGIWVIPQWSVGVSGRYSYYRQKRYFWGEAASAYHSHIWGGSVFTQLLPVPDFSEILPVKMHGGIMLHAEYERLLIDRRMIDPFGSSISGKTWVELFLAGVGYRQKLGDRAALNIMLLWELSGSSSSPYPQNPMIRVNFTL